MKYIVLFILSIESLSKNPANWFGKQPWLLRMLSIIVIIPIISIISILTYQNIYNIGFSNSADNNQEIYSDLKEIQATLKKNHNLQIEEIVYLREEVSQLKKSLQSSKQTTTHNAIDSDTNANTNIVLGTQDSIDSQADLKQRLEQFTADNIDNPNIKSVYIRSDDDSVIMHEKPLETSATITDFDIGTFYPALSEKGNWQEIDFGNGQTAWIDMKYIIVFPIDENH